MTVKIVSLILTYIIVVEFTKAELTGFIVGGKYSKIKDFPYSAFLHITLNYADAGCGASIVNQRILLTAAHCIQFCKKSDCILTVYTGSKRKYVGTKSNVIGYKMHSEFDEAAKTNDIALLMLQIDLELGKHIKRIIVMKNPPKYRTGKVAGWGLVTETERISSFDLQHTTQRILNRETCIATIRMLIPKGTFCVRDNSYPKSGDSGSALVVKKRTIQIGIVASVGLVLNMTTVIYTDVPYYYDWIMENARTLYCDKNKWKQEQE